MPISPQNAPEEQLRLSKIAKAINWTTLASLVVVFPALLILTFASDAGATPALEIISYTLFPIYPLLVLGAFLISFIARRFGKSQLSLFLALLPLLSPFGGFALYNYAQHAPSYRTDRPQFVCADGSSLVITGSPPVTIAHYPGTESVSLDESMNDSVAFITSNPTNFQMGGYDTNTPPEQYEAVKNLFATCRDAKGETMYDYYRVQQTILPPRVNPNAAQNSDVSPQPQPKRSQITRATLNPGYTVNKYGNQIISGTTDSSDGVIKVSVNNGDIISMVPENNKWSLDVVPPLSPGKYPVTITDPEGKILVSETLTIN